MEGDDDRYSVCNLSLDTHVYGLKVGHVNMATNTFLKPLYYILPFRQYQRASSNDLSALHTVLKRKWEELAILKQKTTSGY